MLLTTALLLAAVQLAAAHFSIEYPIWRSDSLKNQSYLQYTYPCAGVPSNLTNANRTDWPLTGGSLKLDLHHPWTYVFVNLGLGDAVSAFNYTLTTPFWNETGNGTLCVPKLALPFNATDGQTASLQVVTVGESGEALYNCADITFRANATTLPGDQCVTDKGVSFSPVNQEVNGSTAAGGSGNSSSSSSSNSTGGGGKNAGAATGVSMLLMSGVVGVAVVFAFGMGL